MSLPFRGRIDTVNSAPGRFFLVAVKHYDTFNDGGTTLNNVNMVFIMSQGTNSLLPGQNSAVLYPSYVPTSNPKRVNVSDTSGAIYSPIVFTAKPATNNDGWILTTGDSIVGTTENQYLVPAITNIAGVPYYSSTSSSRSQENSFRMRFHPQSGFSIPVDNLYVGVPYKITLPNANNINSTWVYENVEQGGSSLYGSAERGYYLSTSYNGSLTGTDFVFYLIPEVHAAIINSNNTCHVPTGEVYYDINHLPASNSTSSTSSTTSRSCPIRSSSNSIRRKNRSSARIIPKCDNDSCNNPNNDDCDGGTCDNPNNDDCNYPNNDDCNYSNNDCSCDNPNNNDNDDCGCDNNNDNDDCGCDDNGGSTGLVPIISNPTGLDALYLYIKYGYIIRGTSFADEVDYNFSCPNGWTELTDWESTTTQNTFHMGKACGFSSVPECQNLYWYDYCTGTNRCGAGSTSGCRGTCTNASKICSLDTSLKPAEPFNCGEEPGPIPPIPPTPTSFTWIIIIVAVLIGLLFIGLIVYFAYSGSGKNYPQELPPPSGYYPEYDYSVRMDTISRVPYD